MRDMILIMAGFCAGVCVVGVVVLLKQEGYTWRGR